MSFDDGGALILNEKNLYNLQSEMDSEQIFLKWNNFESNLASGFADLLQREAMVDVTLAAEGKIVQAHKIILSICSSYFKNMFQVNPCQHPIVVLKDVRYQELTDMLDFMYKGEVNVRQEDLPSFLKLAETLRVKGLAGNHWELDENSIKKNFKSQILSSVKDSSPLLRVEPSNDISDKDITVPKKKSKRCLSPFVYSESKNLPLSSNIKMEIREGDNSMQYSVNSGGQITVMKEERLSDSSVDSYGDNQIVNEILEVEKNAGPSSLDGNSDVIQQEIVRRTKDYSFVESCFGGRLLILGGFSYRRKSITSEKSYWFCCTAKCPAKGILRADGEFQITNTTHNHKPDFENIKRKEKLVELKKLALKMNASGQELLQTLNIKDDIKKHLNFIRTCRRRDKKRNRHIISTQVPLHVGLNYTRLPSRAPSKEMLVYSGYYFRQDSVNPHNDKCKYWRCRVKKCKARAKTDDIGNLIILKPIHNHPLEKGREETSNNMNQMVMTSRLESECSTLLKSASVQKDILKKFNWKGRRETEKDNREKFKMDPESNLNMEETNSTFCHSATDSETFSFEKLMAETLAENYCDSTGFNESLILLKNE